MTTSTQNTIFKAQLAALLLMAAGWGWICGNFVQPVSYGFGQFADVLHVLPFVALLLLSLRLFQPQGTTSRGARIGINIVAAFSILACVVFIVLGAINPDPNSVGVHNFEDTMPVIVLNAGTLLWFVTLFFARRNHTQVSETTM
jgi:phosphoglycerol transferase MdoB-like AlkP superfamily enzyme